MASAPPVGLWSRAVAWGQRNMPTREGLERNRWIRPVAHRVLHPALWRANRRSVPRGVALGMVTGILFPVAQIFFSALLAFPLRANIPAAALTTFVTNPFTTPPLWLLAYLIGEWLLRVDAHVPGQLAAEAAEQIGWVPWLMEKGAAFGLGLVVLTIVLSALGYALSALGWRLWIARKWRSRQAKQAD
jgi:uncharacterized protein (DUF2062 family)